MSDATTCFYIRAERLDVTIYSKEQHRRGTRKVITSDVNQNDVDTQWQKVLVEKGEI